jgi:hypothetical protein
MPSPAYALFEQAMREQKQVACTYGDHERQLCPIILGHSGGREKALTFQFGGSSSSGLPPGGEWRCLFLSRVSNVRLVEGPWRSGSRHTQPSRCVEEVDLDVNPDSPYRPRRQLE